MIVRDLITMCKQLLKEIEQLERAMEVLRSVSADDAQHDLSLASKFLREQYYSKKHQLDNLLDSELELKNKKGLSLPDVSQVS